MNYTALNGDSFVIGRLMGAFDLGLYNRAYGLMNLPQSIALVALAAASVPWGLRTVWLLGKPEFESLRAGLPRPARRLVETLDPRRRAAREAGRSQT